MGERLDPEYKTFTLHVRCENCMRESFMGVAVPKEDGSPTDVDELLESAVLNNLPFKCSKCPSLIGKVIGAEEGSRKR
ncbi:hypothetical protein ACI0FM_14715 [Paenochrobactrum sp. BZR 588]|uniref:hypothetical protein n=1 Tax=unclassified Paenochrobactrum TaxID=2639760 RepID=UPI0038551EAF